MKTCFLALAAVAVLGSAVAAQAVNDPAFNLVVNGNDGAPPIQVTVIKPGTIEIVTSSATPNVPFVLILGATYAPATLDFSVVTVDVSAPQILLDGINPTSFLDFFANTGPGASSTLGYPIGINIPLGPIGALQAIGLEPTAPFGVADTAVTELLVDEPCDYGTLLFGVGTSTLDQAAGFVSSSGSAGAIPGLSDYDLQPLNPNTFQQFIGNSSAPGSIHREQVPFPEPQSNQENGTFEYIRTLYGDLYHFEDNATGEFGFFLVNGTTITEIPGSRMPNGTSATSPWEIEVGISNDQSMLAAVFDPLSGSDQVFVMKLDGTTFPGGASIVDVTPLSAPVAINEESLTIVNGMCYFVDGTVDGFLYRVDLAAPGPGNVILLPPLGIGLPSLIVDGELFVHGPSQSIVLQGGASTTTEDLYVISNIGGGVDTITNVSNFPTATQIEVFGDSWDGVDGRISVSPDGSRVAFVVQTTSTQEDVFWTTTDGSMVAQNLTPDAAFAAALDTVLDLNFHANDGLFFFYGTSTTLMDLYHADLGGMAPAYVNVTATSGSTTVPFASGGTIEADGYFTLPDRMIFSRDGTLTFGPSAGTTNAFNLVGVLYGGPNALTPYNVTGDEFGTTVPGSGITANGSETIGTGLELVFAPTGTMVWFKSAVHPSTTNEDLWAFDAASTAPAFRFGLDASGSVIDNIRPDPSGFTSLFSWETTADEEIHQAIFTLPGATQLTNDPNSTSNDVTDGSIRYFAPGAGCLGFFYAQGTNSTTTPTDAQLYGFDLSAGSGFVIADTPLTYWTFGVSYP